jgi:tRNA U34 2-thiouridine synthase MnmA/TrmU
MKDIIKALVLFSGGLDSQLVIKILKEQGIEVIALYFILPFGVGCCSDKIFVFNFSQIETVPLRFIDCTKGKNFREYLEIIKKPKFGRGAGLNPCIDCRIFMLKRAKQMMKKIGTDFIATGEVLGERPMSQTFRALKIIEKETGLENKILRPLSAKLLPETEAEKKGLVDREKLYAISGRRRLPQMELAKKFELKNYPSPAGGCLLCDKEFSKRFKAMLDNFKKVDENDTELLKLGRHFWYNPQTGTCINTKKYAHNLIVVGRNHEENLKIKNLARRGDILIELKDIPGPTTLIRGEKISKKTIEEAKKLTQKYSKKAEKAKKKKADFKIFQI